MNKTTFIVMEEWRNRHSDEGTQPVANCATRELAEKVIAEKKETINELWKSRIDFNDGWEEEVDEPGHYVLADTCDYDDYYELWIVNLPMIEE